MIPLRESVIGLNFSTLEGGVRFLSLEEKVFFFVIVWNTKHTLEVSADEASVIFRRPLPPHSL